MLDLRNYDGPWPWKEGIKNSLIELIPNKTETEWNVNVNTGDEKFNYKYERKVDAVECYNSTKFKLQIGTFKA